MNFVRRIRDVLLNVFYYKIVLMLFLIPTLLVFCVSFNYKILFIMMGWGALLCLYDLIVKRNFVKARGMVWLIGFLVVFAVAVVLNYKTGFSSNVSSFAYTAIALFILYPDSELKNKETALKEISVINNIFLGMTTVLSTISLGMFVTLFSYEIYYGDQKYVMGWSQNRLFGMYANTGYMITAIALAIACIQIAVYKAKGKKMSKPYKAFIIYTSLVNFLSMCLENAKGAFFSIFGFAAIAVFFLVSEKIIRKGGKALKATAVSLVAAVLAVGALAGSIFAVRPVLSYVPVAYEKITDGNGVHNPSDLTDGELDEDGDKGINLDRDIPEGYGFLTGRTIIWKFGLEQFMKKPIFGYGPQSHRSYYVVDNYLRHFHNLIVQIFVSVGTVGAVFILGFFLTVFIFILKALFKMRKSGSAYYAVASMILAFLGMLLVNSMAEVTVLFIARFAMFLFWMYIGYIQVFLDSENNSKGTAFLEKANEKINNLFKKQENNEK